MTAFDQESFHLSFRERRWSEVVGVGWEYCSSGPDGGVGFTGNNGWWRSVMWIVVCGSGSTESVKHFYVLGQYF